MTSLPARARVLPLPQVLLLPQVPLPLLLQVLLPLLPQLNEPNLRVKSPKVGLMSRRTR